MSVHGMYMYVYICIFMYKYVNLGMYAYVCICLYMSVHACICLYIYVYVCISIYIYACVCIHAHMYIDIVSYTSMMFRERRKRNQLKLHAIPQGSLFPFPHCLHQSLSFLAKFVPLQMSAAITCNCYDVL